jgi:maltose alpha-D-glucosyltransferase/alpha-amylase
MLNNNRQWMELAYSLMFTLPGTPVLRYGDEIGMGEDLSLPERNSVRTAMQWSNEKHGGFSASGDKKISTPILTDHEYGYAKINVHAQMRDPLSFLNWMERIIAVRKECIEFGYGNYEIIEVGHPGVFAHVCHYKGGTSLAVHNLTDQPLTITLGKYYEHLLEYFADQEYDPVKKSVRQLQLGPFGYRWFRKSPLFIS